MKPRHPDEEAIIAIGGFILLSVTIYIVVKLIQAFV